jgi:hypothetical protein
MKRLPIFATVLAGILLLTIGCSDNATDSQDEITGLNLHDEFGGYTTSAEQPGFGDADLIESEEEEQLVEDVLAASPEVQSMSEDPASGFFRFRAVWGQLRLDTTVTEVTDWTGSIEISRGGMLVRKTIRFEPNDGLLPRTHRKLVEWESRTTIHNDGIVVDLIIPKLFPTFDTTVTYEVDSLGDSTKVFVVDTIPPDVEPVTVAFRTGPYSRTFSLAEVAALDTIVTLDDSNMVAFSGMQILRCPRGFLGGRWGRDDEGRGVFRGKWIDHFGRIAGWLRGHYGVDDDGLRVFFGKWINRGGDFEGFLRGTWHPRRHDATDAESAMRCASGRFEGTIYRANRTPIGRLGGHYGTAPWLDGGFFMGRWKLACPDEPRPDDRLDSNWEPYSDGMRE